MEAAIRSMTGFTYPPQVASGNPDGHGDEVLVQAACAGDRQACQAIWKKYAALVQRLVWRFFGPGPDQPDVCQEAFLRVFKRLKELREPAALPGFIMAITLGVARNEARRKRIRAIVGLGSPDEWPTTAQPGEQNEARETLRSLYRLLSQLGAEDRSLFTARFVEKMEMSDVAIVHAISLSTAKRRVARLVLRINVRMKSEPALLRYVGLLGLGGTSE